MSCIFDSVKHTVLKPLKTLRRNQQQHHIENRIKTKIANGEKIKVLFLCHRPSVWGALKTAYEAFEKDPFFETMMVTLPQKDSVDSTVYHDEGADQFFSDYHPIRGFNPETKAFLDIKKLHPDLVFYQQPYDVARNHAHRSSQVCKYAKIGYVSYFSIFPEALVDFAVADTCYPRDFFRNISYYFSQNTSEELYIHDMFKKTGVLTVRTFKTGYPKYDHLEIYQHANSSVWTSAERSGRFRIMWTPRWTTNENNCHFFDYKDFWIQYCKDNPHVDFIFRPHPQSWIEWKNTGEFSEEQQQLFRISVDAVSNMTIDETKDYLPAFYSSDCLVSDMSSILYEYILTGKPIIYCEKNGTINTYQRESNIGRAFYWAESWQDVLVHLNNIEKGFDPLKEYRENYIKSEFMIDPSCTAGEKIKNCVKESFLRF